MEAQLRKQQENVNGALENAGELPKAEIDAYKALKSKKGDIPLCDIGGGWCVVDHNAPSPLARGGKFLSSPYTAANESLRRVGELSLLHRTPTSI